MDNEDRPFVVFKFSDINGDSDDILYDVGLSKWVKCCEENMNGIIKWPPKTVTGQLRVGLLARKKKDSENDWKEFPIHIKGYYDTYLKASQACKKYVKDSNYESEAELGRGLRKKRSARINTESDSESDDGRKNKRMMKHKLEEKIPSPPQVLLSGCYVRSLSKDLQNYPKHFISKQLPKKTQDNVFQENCEKNSSYACESTCEQNKISIETASDSGSSDKNPELLRKLEQVKILKRQTSNKKKTILDKRNRFSYNKDEESQKEYFESNNETKNESALHDMAPHSSSYQDLQGKEKRKAHKLIPQSKGGFSKESSSMTANKLSYSINTSCIVTPVKQITMEHSSNSRDTILCPDSPDTMSSKSSESLQRYDVIEREDSHRSSLTFNSTGTEYSSSKKNSIVDSSAQSLCRELTLIKTAIMECNKEIRRVSSKLDIFIMNQENPCRSIIPGEKIIKRPSEMPPLPINTFEELGKMEKFLVNDSNLTGACSYLGKNIDKKSVENSVRRILAKLMTNTLASKFSLHGHRNKRRFDALKLWDVVQGALLTKFEICDISVAEKSAATWLTNSSWRKQEDGSFGKRTEQQVFKSLKEKKNEEST